ncbi:YobI family P-loop NTPase [Microbacterium maritypicum]
MTEIELRSLAPEYNETHHKTYVSRLNAAVVDPRNRNIALTGRYGAGKSSILDQFIEEQGKPDENKPKEEKRKGRKATPRKKVVRISISTLGPDDDGDLTNRIQKELVKQLVYRAKPGELRTSRFARAPELTWWRAAIDAFVLATAIVGLLWLFGLRPLKDSLGTDTFLLPMIALFVLIFATLWALRWLVGRRTVSQFSTGGASIAFEEKTDSFFDKYLDELVAFFEATEPDIVVFEDLDRFDDPQIFDSLRELNTLVNASAHWRDRPNEPLRFIYAIKDSLFEKLGDEQLEKDAGGKPSIDESSDHASGLPVRSTPNANANIAPHGAKKKGPVAEAVERANRTKFFEIVIPVVPFLSHSNARDLFLEELNKLDLPDDTVISRGLIDIVARHTTDMRLMINIGNEFVVYAERLLWVDEENRAPGITPDRLFALVVYKNFHLADFESLPHRGSALDTLEQARRDLVDAAIRSLQQKRASLAGGLTRRLNQREMARTLGHRLQVLLESTGMTLRAAKAGDASLDLTATSEPSFWQPVAQSRAVEMALHHRSGNRDTAVLGDAQLTALFPEAADSDSWADSSSQADAGIVAEIDEEIAALRGASFQHLVEDDRYQHNSRAFSTIVEQTLPSKLGRDLVRQGYLDRYYAEYATVFYGKFLGVDVANFYRNSVWPNEMDMQFLFTTEGGVANVLAHAPVDFLQTRSALNVDIVDYLLDTKSSSASDLVAFLARPNNKHALEFLKTYFNSPGSRSADLASLLAEKPWLQLFNFIASEDTVDADETRVRLLSAALMNAREADNYEIDDDARALIARLHTLIPAFTEPQPEASVDALFSILASAIPSIPSLRALSPKLQDKAVAGKQYAMTADNIRTAELLTDTSPISIESLANRSVREYCEERVDEYLDVVNRDGSTPWSCASSEVLASIVNAKHDTWTTAQMERFLVASSPAAALADITSIEQIAWKTVTASTRIVANVANIDAYATELGVDDTLAAFLVGPEGNVVDILGLGRAGGEQLERLVPRLLNAGQVLEPAARVALTAQLMTSPDGPDLDLSAIEATPDDLLAELLRAKLIEDSEATFAHFAAASWPSVGPALRVSSNAARFITPGLVAGKAAELVRDRRIPVMTRRALLDRLVEFAPSGGQEFLTAAAETARELRVPLTDQALAQVAPFIQSAEDVLWQLRKDDGSRSADAMRDILGRIPGEFAGFAHPSGHEFDVPESESLTVILDQLRADGVIGFPPGRSAKGRRKIRIA